MSNDKLNLLPYVKEFTPSAKKLMDIYFPGALTIVSDKSEKTPDFITSGKNTVGIRVPDNKFFQKLCSIINGHVLATTSANLSSHPSSKTYVEAVKSIGNMVDFVFEDYGCECAGMESTVVLIQSNTLRILRQGSIFLEN